MAANDAKLTWRIDFKDEESLLQFSKIITACVYRPNIYGGALYPNDIVRVARSHRTPDDVIRYKFKIEIDVCKFVKRFSYYELTQLTNFINDKLMFEIIQGGAHND